MPVFKTCVVRGDKIFCWDEVRRKVVRAVLDVDAYSPVPEDVEREVCAKRFGLLMRTSEPIMTQEVVDILCKQD
jgi:hypothetical protein